MRIRRRLRNLPAILLGALLLACIVGAFFTRAPAPAASSSAVKNAVIDDSLLQTAHRLASGANTADEQSLARDALRLADNELDEGFATALRDATTLAPRPTGAMKQLSDRVNLAKARIAADQSLIAKLSGAPAGSDEDQLALAKAQLALDQDELEDAQDDMSRQGDDKETKIREALAEHEAAQHSTQMPAIAAMPLNTLNEQVWSWFALGGRLADLRSAQKTAMYKAGDLMRRHNRLEQSVSANGGAGDDMNAAIARMNRLADEKKTLSEFDKRFQDCSQLADVYGRWIGAVQTERLRVMHMVLRSLAIVFAILFTVILVDRSIRHAFRSQHDRRRLHHMRVMATIAVQVTGVVFILLIAFGPPSSLATVFGLVTAGLTVALKDFVVAFFGWFALMGKNGIHIGDWVEIDGVGGEVIEIGVLRTVLLEMGNSNNTGHPTGRRVSFVNNFAIEGHYFNFSTAGQWLWDELQVSLPGTGDPYQTAEQIRQTVERETEADSRAAQEDWERVTHQYGTRPFSARPIADLRPSITGLDVFVRYITRAPQRYEVKSRLFEAIVKVLHDRPEREPAGYQQASG